MINVFVCVCSGLHLKTFEIPHWCDLDSLLRHRQGQFDWPADEAYKPTWCEEAVEVTDNGTKRGPECGLVVHAAGDQVSQFGPLWGRKLVVVFIEQAFLQGYYNAQMMNKGHTVCQNTTFACAESAYDINT